MKQTDQKKPEKFRHDEETKKRKAEVIESLTEIYRKFGTRTFSKKSLAQKFNVSEKTIWAYGKDIFSKIPQESLNETYFNLMGGADVAYGEVRKILNDQEAKHSDKIAAARAIVVLNDSITKVLENYGKKPKVAENGEFDDVLERIRQRMRTANEKYVSESA